MPTTTGKATDFITFTRASNATVTDADGKIKWAPHNLLLNSESFDASAWTKSLTTVTSNAVAAPDGATTADKLIATAAAGFHNITQSGPAAGVTYTYSVYAKAAEYSYLWLEQVATTANALFNLSTGAITNTGAGATSSITALSNGWYLCSITFSSSSTAAVGIGVTNSTSWSSYTGTGTSGIYLWGAHLYRSDLGGMQPNTSAYPMYNPTTPKSLLGYSEDIENGAWGGRTRITIAKTSVKAPNGIGFGYKANPSGNSANDSYFYQNISLLNGSAYTFSAYMKDAGLGWGAIFIGGGATAVAYFNLSAGALGSVSGSATGKSSSITPVGDGWYRCSLTANAPSSASYAIGFSMAEGDGDVTFASGTSNGVYIWGAQLSDSASLDAYVPSYGAAVTSAAYYGPRRDFDPVTLACKGLLVEEQRSNLLQYSEELTNAYWGTSGSPTVTANTAIAPSGQQTADTITGSGSAFSGVVKHVTSTNGTTYTSSVYIKSDTSPFAAVLVNNGNAGAWVNLSTGAVATTGTLVSTPVATSVGNGWWRLTLVVVATGTSHATVWVAPTSASGVNTGTGSIFAWGAQIEAGSFATSYIPTGAATATRSADVASVATSAFPYSATEGTVVANFMPLFVSTANVIFNLGAGLDSNSLYSTSGPSQNLVVRSAGSTTVLLSAGGFTVGQASKLGAAFKSSDYAVVTNGGTVATVGSGALPTGSATTFALGGGAPLTGGANGHIRQITYLPRRISNADLTARTA